jgi:hypothetical protein
MSSFDVWVMRFEPGETSPAERLQRVFGIDASSARTLEMSLPKIVKHGVPAKTAGEMRQALEAIGAVVDCRPAKDSKPRGEDAPAVFHAPDADLFPAGRVSAIDPFAPVSDASVPRISVDEAAPAVQAPKSLPDAPEASPTRIASSLLATSQAQQRNKYLRQALGTLLAGAAIIAIGWFLGNSVFRGGADLVAVGFDGLGIYFVGLGVFDLVATLRS